MQSKWRSVVQRLVRSEMSLRNVTYQALSQRLSEIGVDQTAENLRNKVNKGIMGADLLLQILVVLRARSVTTDMLEDLLADIDQGE